jgi:hypothetical protein
VNGSGGLSIGEGRGEIRWESPSLVVTSGIFSAELSAFTFKWKYYCFITTCWFMLALAGPGQESYVYGACGCAVVL